MLGENWVLPNLNTERATCPSRLVYCSNLESRSNKVPESLTTYARWNTHKTNFYKDKLNTNSTNRKALSPRSKTLPNQGTITKRIKWKDCNKNLSKRWTHFTKTSIEFSHRTPFSSWRSRECSSKITSGLLEINSSMIGY